VNDIASQPLNKTYKLLGIADLKAGATHARVYVYHTNNKYTAWDFS